MNEAIEAMPSVRERILDAACKLFSLQGIGATGIDAIVAESGCAKSSLYNNFKSKEELALAFLDARESSWTRSWLEAKVRRRSTSPEGRLLAVFDVFDEWFRSDGFEGCSFINVLLETRPDSPVADAAARQLGKIRGLVGEFVEQAGYVNPETLASVWHMLMKGAIVAAAEGNREAAMEARRAGGLLLDGWARRW